MSRSNVYEKNEIITQRIQTRNFARRFERSLICELSFGNSRSRVLKSVVFDAQTTDQVRCEPFKTTAKFQWFWILYVIISFFSYTRTAIQITTGVYGERCWLSILIFANGRFKELVNYCFKFLKHLDKSVLFDFFHFPFMNTKIINSYRLTYTLCSGLNSVPLYEIEIR